MLYALLIAFHSNYMHNCLQLAESFCKTDTSFVIIRKCIGNLVTTSCQSYLPVCRICLRLLLHLPRITNQIFRYFDQQVYE